MKQNNQCEFLKNIGMAIGILMVTAPGISYAEPLYSPVSPIQPGSPPPNNQAVPPNDIPRTNPSFENRELPQPNPPMRSGNTSYPNPLKKDRQGKVPPPAPANESNYR